jgi:hypothetical protein
MNSGGKQSEDLPKAPRHTRACKLRLLWATIPQSLEFEVMQIH